MRLSATSGSEPEVLLVLYTGIFKCATAGIRMQSLFYFLSVYWVFFFQFQFLVIWLVCFYVWLWVWSSNFRHWNAVNRQQKKKTDKKYHGSIVNGLDQGKKSVQETEGASIWQFPKTNLSSGDEQRYQEHKQGSIPRWDKWAHFFLQGACFDLTIPKDKLEHKQVDSTFRQVRTVFFGAVPKCWKYHKTLRFFSTERANEGSSLAADHGRKFNSNRKWVDVEYDWNFGLENQMKRKRIRTESGWM